MRLSNVKVKLKKQRDMKIKVSKVFADFINKTAKELGFCAEASVQRMSERGYVLNVGMAAQLDADDYGDYDWAEDEYKVIRVVYPEEYYACPQYLTTKALNDEYNRRGVSTIDELKQMLKDILSI